MTFFIARDLQNDIHQLNRYTVSKIVNKNLMNAMKK